MTVQVGLCRTWSEITLLVFPRGGSNITYLTNYDFDDNFIQIERYCEMDVSMLESFLSYQPLGVQLRKGTVMVIAACRLVIFFLFYSTIHKNCSKAYVTELG